MTKKIGIRQTSDLQRNISCTNKSRSIPGQIRVQDLNGDGKIDQNDRQPANSSRIGKGMTNRVTTRTLIFNCDLRENGMKVVVPYITADGGAQGFPFSCRVGPTN
jgi:hypothetical protein